MVEKEIIQQCCKGSRTGHKAFYEGTIRYVYSTVSRYIYQEEDKKDVVQEAYAKIFGSIKTFDSAKGNLNTWVRKVAVNECLMHIRKNKKLSYLTPVDSVEGMTAGEDPSIALDSLTKTDIGTLLKKMPEGYRMVFMLNILEGYDHKEIGQLLNIQAETSRSQLARAKKWIKKNIINHNSENAYGLF